MALSKDCVKTTILPRSATVSGRERWLKSAAEPSGMGVEFTDEGLRMPEELLRFSLTQEWGASPLKLSRASPAHNHRDSSQQEYKYRQNRAVESVRQIHLPGWTQIADSLLHPRLQPLRFRTQGLKPDLITRESKILYENTPYHQLAHPSFRFHQTLNPFFKTAFETIRKFS